MVLNYILVGCPCQNSLNFIRLLWVVITPSVTEGVTEGVITTRSNRMKFRQGSENETMFWDTYNYFQVDCRSRLQNTKWPAVLYSQWISQVEKIQLNWANYHIMSRSWTSRLWDFYIMFLLGTSLLIFETIFMMFLLVGNFTDFSLLMHHFVFNLFPQNGLVWSGSRHMIVWFSWIFSICDPRSCPTNDPRSVGMPVTSNWKVIKIVDVRVPTSSALIFP